MPDQLAALWGFSFPKDLLDVWKVAKAIDAKKPLSAFHKTIGVVLCGPFEVLAGKEPEPDLGRWSSDPPELFTVARGNTDGLHWGYFVHEPGTSEPICAHFYARDSAEISIDGTLFESLRGWLRDVREEMREEAADAGGPGDELKDVIRATDRALAIFSRSPKKKAPKPPPLRGQTLDTLGIVCAPKLYEAPYTLDRRKLVEELRDETQRQRHIQRARDLLAKGKPGGALHVARDLYFALPEKELALAVPLLREAYAALGRPVLARAIAHVAAAPTAQAPAPAARVPAPSAQAPTPSQLRQCTTAAEVGQDPGSVESLQINGGAPPTGEQFRAMKQLRHLHLFAVEMRELPIDELPIETLTVDYCRLASFPPAIASLRRLVELKLFKMEHALPPDLSFPALVHLVLDQMNLVELPPFVLRTHSIRVLSLSKNRIRQIPPEIADLDQLSQLRLPGNQLATLPDSIAALAGTLRFLNLKDNPVAKNKAERARIAKMLPNTKITWA